MAEEGLKFDTNKPRFSLIPVGVLREVIAVFEYGANKYKAWNHLNVSDYRERYYNAAIRHLLAWYVGEENDKESGLPHLAHALCCLFIIRHRDLLQKEASATLAKEALEVLGNDNPFT